MKNKISIFLAISMLYMFLINIFNLIGNILNNYFVYQMLEFENYNLSLLKVNNLLLTITFWIISILSVVILILLMIFFKKNKEKNKYIVPLNFMLIVLIVLYTIAIIIHVLNSFFVGDLFYDIVGYNLYLISRKIMEAISIILIYTQMIFEIFFLIILFIYIIDIKKIQKAVYSKTLTTLQVSIVILIFVNTYKMFSGLLSHIIDNYSLLMHTINITVQSIIGFIGMSIFLISSFILFLKDYKQSNNK